VKRATPSKFDRRIQFQRRLAVQDPYGVAETWMDNGPMYWADVRERSVTEAPGGGQIIAGIATSFVVRHDSFTRNITAVDRIVFEGTVYNITGRRELPGRRREIEFMASARDDLR
jgi:SPP1 family predicted phage head-tail adaptor